MHELLLCCLVILASYSKPKNTQVPRRMSTTSDLPLHVPPHKSCNAKTMMSCVQDLTRGASYPNAAVPVDTTDREIRTHQLPKP